MPTRLAHATRSIGAMRNAPSRHAPTAVRLLRIARRLWVDPFESRVQTGGHAAGRASSASELSAVIGYLEDLPWPSSSASVPSFVQTGIQTAWHASHAASSATPPAASRSPETAAPDATRRRVSESPQTAHFDVTEAR